MKFDRVFINAYSGLIADIIKGLEVLPDNFLPESVRDGDGLEAACPGLPTTKVIDSQIVLQFHEENVPQRAKLLYDEGVNIPEEAYNIKELRNLGWRNITFIYNGQRYRVFGHDADLEKRLRANFSHQKVAVPT